MSICQRSDGRWVVKVKDPLRPGRWKQHYFKTKEEALEFQDEQQQDAPESNRLTVYEAVMLYLKSKNLSKSVRDAYVWVVSGAETVGPCTKKPVGYAECIAEKYVDSLTRRDLEMVRDAARAGGAGNVSINKWVQKLEAAFNFCAAEGIVPENPWAKFRSLDMAHSRHDGSAEDFQKIYAVLPAWMQWACRLAAGLFLRPGNSELFSLRWSAWDWAHGCVRVHMGKVGRDKTVYAPAWLLQEAAARFRADGGDLDALCVRTDRGGSGRYAYSHAMRAARAKAGVKKFPMYALRHLTATHALAEGADPAAVAAQLGHASPAITLAYYAHAMPAGQRAAAATVPPLPAPPADGAAVVRNGAGKGAGSQ